MTASDDDIEFEHAPEDMIVDETEETAPTRVWRAGIDKLEDGETLDYDNSAYLMYHAMNMEWPSLSFDVLRDELGEGRVNLPATCYFVSGSQADKKQNNRLTCMKVSNLHKDDESEDPILQHCHVKHEGTVNRVRSCMQKSSVVASWSDLGMVHIYDLVEQIQSLETKSRPKSCKPLFSYEGHADEGFAMDWSPLTPGRLVTGDCSKYIYVWESQDLQSWQVNKMPYASHGDSVEDLQWSPTESQVFASCSVDKTVKIWDARKHANAALSIQAHDMDVNVISWNPMVTYLVVSGCDDGSFRIWDLRNPSQPAAHFKWHHGPITSVEWHPQDGSVVAVSGADDQLSIWDLSLEKDRDEKDEEFPAQLLFVHQGQADIKEIHWHPQMPGVLLSTASDGMNVFKPANLEHVDA